MAAVAAPGRRVLLLEHVKWEEGEACVVLRSLSGPIACGAKEPAGAAFHEAVLRQQGLLDDCADDDGASESTAAGSEPPPGSSRPPSSAGLGASASEADLLQPPPGVSWKRSKPKQRRGDKKKKEADYYALLGLGQERWMATEQQIKLAYRRTCLEAHPDKRLAGVEDPAEKQRIEDAFKLIQEAYEALSDPARRREYDSTDEFDDSLPTACDPADFFRVFAPAFRRNARWSADPNVPDVGDADTPYEQVAAFYDFWFAFKSWREFPHEDEEDVEAAESREHRRWIERINAKLREKGKKEEGRRLREFVDAAWRIDPRVAARKEEERLERERKKAEKEEAKRLQREEEERQKAEAEAKRLAVEEAAREAAAEAKRQREADKKALKRERQRLRAIVSSSDGGGGGGRLLDEDATERLCQGMGTAELAALCDAAGADGLAPAARLEVLQRQLAAMDAADAAAAEERERQKQEAALALKDIAKRDHERRMASMSAWTDEELRLLDKAAKKFPVGTPKRWEAVTAYVRTRPLDEVLLMVKERQGAASNRLRQQEDWKGAAKKRAEVKSEADLRCQAFTDVAVDLSGVAGSSGGGGTGGGTSGGGGGGGGAESSSSTATAANGGAADSGDQAAAKPPKRVVSAASGEWSEAQELALVQGLKEHGKELPDRWERIAAAVGGKTKAQCMKRFKELKEAFKAQKA